MTADSNTLSLSPRRGGGPAIEPQLTLLLQTTAPRRPSVRYRLGDIDEVRLARGAEASAERDAAARRLRLAVPDGWMSSRHALLARAAGAWRLTDEGSKNGTRVNGERAQEVTLSDGDVIEVGQTFFLFRERVSTPADAPAELAADQLGVHPALATLVPGLSARFDELARIAASKTSLVLSGATGSGKEMLARAVHELSRRRGAFVPVNCAALPEGLVESELFGHVRGAFSGADRDREGLLAAAGGGTLFLDEIGDLPRAAQAKLLRALQEQEVRPVGATEALKVDLRVVAATHRDLQRQVEEDAFREDLLARLGDTFELPPLRERREDLGLLIAALLGRIEDPRAADATFTVEAVRAVTRHDWPRNVRELAKALERAIALADGRPIDVAHLPEDVRSVGRRSSSPSPAPPDPDALTDEERARREQLAALLVEHKGNVAAVARAMGVVRSQIQRWMKRYGLTAP
ncbi:MAG TPA: sigma 54-interacting transcriptional regulator [Kofleriaceae bacterium]|nr:sigma 54-interacting transcriptional regulator [Kofleriaceae bacterium]